MADADDLLHPDHEERIHAWRQLRRDALDGDEAARATLREVVLHPHRFDSEVYSRTLNYVGDFFTGDEAVERALLAALADSGHDCQAYVAMACGKLQLSSAEPLLLPLLHHPDRWRRMFAAEALGAIGSNACVHPLTPWLDDPDEHLREVACQALADIDTDEAAEAVWAAFIACTYDRAHFVAAAVSRLATSPRRGATLFDRLVQAASHPEPRVRYWAARALGGTGDLRAEPILTELMSDMATTRTGALVATGAKQGLKRLRRAAL